MDTNDIQKHIDAIIENTFAALKDVYDHQKEGKNEHCTPHFSRILFPKYSKNEPRYSEQELRFVFVEKFNQYCGANNLDWLYSVETPTEYKYKFTDNGQKKEPVRDDINGKSAMIDLTIHDADTKRIALIEFKALNPDASCFEKDFIKLTEEPETLTYFVMYVKAHDATTISRLREKVDSIGDKTMFYCYDLESGQRIDNEIRSVK